MYFHKFFKNQNSEFKILIGLFFAAILLWFVSLGSLPLRDWDEGYYGIVARDMFRTGNWLYPTYLNEPFLLKPPLMMWLIAFSYTLGGISEFTTRFPGAFLTACGVPLLYLLGKEVFSRPLPAIFSASVYLTLLPVVRLGRLAMLDGAINTFLILSLLCLLKSRQTKLWAVGFGIGLGAIALIKGVLVLVLGAIALFFILLDKQIKLLANPYLWLGVILGFIPVFTWYLLQVEHYGQLFIQTHFYSQSFERLSTSVDGHGGDIWYYFIELIKYTIPWLLFLPGSMGFAWQQRFQTWGILVLVATVMYMGTISLMGTKLPWYIMPIYPFVAIAVGAYLDKLWQTRKQYYRIWVAFLVILAIAALAGCAYFIVAEPQLILIFMAVVLALTMALAAWKVQKQDRIFIPILFIGMYATLLLFVNSNLWIWELNEAFAVKPVANLIQTHTPSNTKIYTSFAYNRPSLDFYSDRKIIATDIPSLQQLATNPVYLLLDNATLERLQLTNSRAFGTAEGFTLIATQP
jgi:4-amino-4-deoxy-L-arabinose transferase-like glycosyltransferase